MKKHAEIALEIIGLITVLSMIFYAYNGNICFVVACGFTAWYILRGVGNE